MKKIKFGWIRTLFAAVLSVSLTVSVLSAFPAARAEETGETSESETNSYRYSVEIEFGSMTFCYDYGTWNPSNLRYETEETQSPAAGTVSGFPGWYGFDGVANKISVLYKEDENISNGSTDTAHDYLQVTLSYRALGSEEGGTSSAAIGMTGVTTELYGDDTLKNRMGSVDGSGYTLTVEKNTGNPVSVWLSLKGEPSVGGASFTSETLVPVGMLTIALKGFSATAGGN